VAHIASLAPRIQIEAASSEGMLFATSGSLTSRFVLVKVKDPDSGKIVFKHPEKVKVEPDAPPATVQLDRVPSPPPLKYGATLEVQVLDADDEEVLDREQITLKVDMDDEWLS